MTQPFPTIVTAARRVPNVFPADPSPCNYRIAVVGEAPGSDEVDHGYPFVGASGNFLNGLLREAGIDRNRCFVGNVCQVRPPGNDITRFDWDGEEIQSGLKQLTSDINEFNPNICLLLGGTPLRSSKGPKSPITSWRGSLFVSDLIDSPFYGRKCIASLHPAFVLREFSGCPLLRFDLKRCLSEGVSPDLVLPSRELLTNLPAGTLLRILDGWPSGVRCSLDIEGGLNGWPCVSICATPNQSVTIAWGRLSDVEHRMVLQAFARLMARTDVPKVLQNSLYDNFVLSYGFGIPIRNVTEDTMLKGWEIYCELPKGLGTQASIWTREPYYKAERKSENSETFFQYCAKDSAVTLEICNAQDNVLTGCGLQHYHANMSMLSPLLYMELRGIKYDQEAVNIKLREVKEIGWHDKDGKWNKSISQIGDELKATAGFELRGDKGSLSAKRLADALYSKLNYPPQFKKEAGRKTEKLTTDIEAILALRRKLPDDEFLNGILQHRHLEGIIETLNIRPDPDGRVRCGYNVVGTETGRLTCYTSPTGAGANLQTITKKLRTNYIADPGYDFFQCDLAGADGWTVGAHAARLGDPTMLNDYLAGLKPAKIIAFIYAFGHANVSQMDREDLLFWSQKREFKAFEKTFGTWLYEGCKVVQHGSSYLMGIPTMQMNLIKKSFKTSGTPIYMDHADGLALQSGMFSRYPGVRTWHQWGQSQLIHNGTLTSASGHTRMFFGRRFGRDIQDTVKEFLADEPQQNTTWATNLAMRSLWRDPDNRIAKAHSWGITSVGGQSHMFSGWEGDKRRLTPGSLIIEPLHSVHDALCGQWPQFVRDWAKKKMHQYFNNRLEIAGRDIIIPFDGGWGPSWGDCETNRI